MSEPATEASKTEGDKTQRSLKSKSSIADLTEADPDLPQDLEERYVYYCGKLDVVPTQWIQARIKQSIALLNNQDSEFPMREELPKEPQAPTPPVEEEAPVETKKGGKGAKGDAEPAEPELVLPDELMLSSTTIDEDQSRVLCALLASAANYKAIRFARNCITEEALTVLMDNVDEGFVKLERIVVDHNEMGSKLGMLDRLMKLENLTTLSLRGNEIDDEGAKQLSSVLKSDECVLETLNLWDNRIGDEGASAIAEALLENRTLKNLSLGRNHIDEKGLECLADSLGLHKLSAEDSKAATEALGKIAELQEEKAQLKKKKGPEEEALNKQIAEYEAKARVYKIQGELYSIGNRVLEYLDLSFNKIPAQAIDSLKQVIVYNIGLKKLLVRGNKSYYDRQGCTTIPPTESELHDIIQSVENFASSEREEVEIEVDKEPEPEEQQEPTTARTEVTNKSKEAPKKKKK